MTWVLMIMLFICLAVLLNAAVQHSRWLARQSPSGIWRGRLDAGRVTLELDGGPLEGTYRQTIERQGTVHRESGHWSARMHTLRLLMTSSERQNDPRFGVDTLYSIRYVNPDTIQIDGPDCPSVIYLRSPDTATVPTPSQPIRA